MSPWVDLKGTASFLRRISAGFVVLVGLLMIVSTFSNNLRVVGHDVEEMMDDFRPVVEEDSVASARADLALLDDVGVEFDAAVVPGLSQQLGMTNDEFVAFTATEFPSVAAGMDALPEILPALNGLIDAIDEERGLFESADTIPMEQLPATVVPWGLLLSAAGLVVGGIVLYKPGSLGPILTGGLGLAILMASLAMNLLPKASDADELNEHLRPVYTPELVAAANDAVATVGAMGHQMQTEMLPTVGSQLGLGQEELGQFVGTNFPATAEALVKFPDAMGRFEGLVEIYDRNFDNYETVEPVSLAPIIRSLLTGSLIVLLATGASMWGTMANGDKTESARVKTTRASNGRAVEVPDLDIRGPMIQERPKVGQGPRP